MPGAVVVKELLRSMISWPKVSRNCQGQYTQGGSEGNSCKQMLEKLVSGSCGYDGFMAE